MLDKETIMQITAKTELENVFLAKEKHNIYATQKPLSALNLRDGSYVKELNSSSKAVNTLLSEECLNMFTKVDKASTEVYMEQLGTNILKVEELMPLNYTIDLVVKLHEELGDTLAGVIAITTTGALINLLHHVVALELVPYMLNEDLSIMCVVNKLLIYTYKDLEVIKSIYDSTTTPKIESFIDNTINQHLLAASAILEPRFIQFSDVTIDIPRRVVTQHYKISKNRDEIKNAEYYMTLHQLLTKGTYVPYYGITIVAITTNDVHGSHISYVKGANISNHSETTGNVCCGKESNRTIEGLRTQHHSNLNSPYERCCMTTSSFTYIKKCIEKSIQLYKSNRN